MAKNTLFETKQKEKKIQPYGSWKSPINATILTESILRFGDLTLDDQYVYWSEASPEKEGRFVVMRWNGEKRETVTPSPFNVRSSVHEYGGAAFTAHHQTLYFCNHQDQAFYSLSKKGDITLLAQEKQIRYANPLLDPKRNQIYLIKEDHLNPEDVKNSLVCIDAKEKKKEKIIHQGHDFYSSLALSHDGLKLAFLSWNHPQMPWDGTTLWMGSLDTEGFLKDLDSIAGGPNESIFQPRFARDDTLYFISDQTGFWNLYEYKDKKITPCLPLEGDLGIPQWILGQSRYDFILTQRDLKIPCIYTVKGIDDLGLIDLKKRTLCSFDLPYTSYQNLHVFKNTLFFQASSPNEMPTLFSYDLKKNRIQKIRSSKLLSIDSAYLSKPQSLTFLTEQKKEAFAFFTPPKNKQFKGPPDESPPLIVKSHGGPTGHANSSLNLETQFFTSRGFAVLDVNYGGSSGYGRQYRERIKNNWGVVDVLDCIHGANDLIRQGLVDPKKVVMKGRSAGGYTTLCALAFHTTFKLGVCYYGVSDLEALAKKTHKFESHYLESLIGPYPKEKKKYQERSPLHHIQTLSAPLLLLQGADDPIVPPSQSEMIYLGLKSHQSPIAYLLFENEAHGFRNAKTIIKALHAELYFYSRFFKIPLKDPIAPIPIDFDPFLK